MTWIKFHEELNRGAWRGVPRAVRYVFLELSLLCRPLRGSVSLPLGMGALEGVLDLLGGDRREVKAALEFLTSGDSPTVVVEGDPGRLTLRIPHWERWNTVDNSAERVRRHRQEAKRQSEQKQEDAPPCNALQPLPPAPLPPLQSVTPVTPLEKSRVDPPIGPPTGGEPEQAPRRTRSRKQPARAMPEGWAPRPEELTEGAKHGFSAARVQAEAERFRDHHQAKGNVFADWHAAFRKWLGNAKKWDAERGPLANDSAAPAPPPAAPPIRRIPASQVPPREKPAVLPMRPIAIGDQPS